MQLFLSTPSYWLVILFLLAFLLSYFTYYGVEKPSKKNFRTPQWFLFLLRLLAIFFTLFLLLSPFIKFQKKELLKPKLVLMIDNSLSVTAQKDVAQSIDDFRVLTQKKLPDFEIATYNLDGIIKPTDSIKYLENNTNLTKPLLQIGAESNEQLRAIVLISDGIINEGANPNYYPLPIRAPIYALGLGDTSTIRDIKVADAKSNEFVVLGNKFPVQFDIIANQCAGQSVQYNVSVNGVNVHSGSTNTTTEHHFFSKEILLDAKTPGIQKIRISTAVLAGEKNKANNNFELFVNVIDNRKKIAIYHQGVHPDIKAVNLALSSQKNYEVKVTNSIAEAIDADVIVAVQVPNFSGNKSDLTAIQQSKKPILLLGGELLDWSAWVPIIGNVGVRSNRPSAAQAHFNKLFSGFTTSKEEMQVLSSLSPMVVPFATYPKQWKPVMYQSINGIVTDYPLIAVTEDKNRVAIVAGEGLWKWYQNAYLKNSDHAAIENLMDHLVQWLLSGKDKPLFSVVSAKSIYDKLDEVYLYAELYNQVYQVLPNEKVTATIKGDSFSKEVTFASNGNLYEVNLGILPAGDFKVFAKTGSLTALTGFSVGETTKEERVLQADWGLLRNLSTQHNGAFYAFADAELLLNELSAQLNKTAVTKVEDDIKDLINIKWLLALIALFFTAEWMLRKYYGKL